MLLCDFAEEIGGKLYIMGGGWDRLNQRGRTSNMALAILLSVPWNETNRPHTLTARLETEDGEPVRVGEEQVMVEGNLEVGRPAGMRPGTDLKLPLAFRFEALPLTAGAYSWVLRAGEEELARSSFSVVTG